MNALVHTTGWKYPAVSDTKIVATILGLLTILGFAVLSFLA